MRFIDLFAGLGGFHMALRDLKHTCVFASEIDETLRDLYEKNFGMRPAGDIRDIPNSEIPHHDILCAGFPCQPFSKARKRNGNSDPELGELYQEITRIIRHHQPGYIIMENVPDLRTHDEGKTWSRIKADLEDAGYVVPEPEPLSPHDFGIPQIRKRIYIVGSRTSLEGFKWPSPNPEGPLDIRSVLDSTPTGAKSISGSVKHCLKLWQDFLDQIPKDERIPLPLWSMEFGATYPYRNTTPHASTTESLRRNFRGSYGIPLCEAQTREEVFALLPSHGRTEQDVFPRWKVNFIEKNRRFYRRHEGWLDDWIQEIRKYPSSFQKFEWNCNEPDPRSEDRRISRYMIQTRPSGVRVKRPTTAPSLVAMTATQVPIIGWEERYMTLGECIQLQSLDEDIHLPETPTRAYAALGNAINVKVAKRVAESLLDHSPEQEDLTRRNPGDLTAKQHQTDKSVESFAYAT